MTRPKHPIKRTLLIKLILLLSLIVFAFLAIATGKLASIVPFAAQVVLFAILFYPTAWRGDRIRALAAERQLSKDDLIARAGCSQYDITESPTHTLIFSLTPKQQKQLLQSLEEN